MAIITRFFFTRFKEVSYQTPSGQVSDEPYGSFSLDNPSQNDGGTIHFFGVMQTRHLLGDLRRVQVNTGVTTIFEYDSLDDVEINRRISNGQFEVTEQRIGWVDLGKATPSFFYNDCNLFSPVSPDGKRPTVNYFYDITQLGLDGSIVIGESTGTPTQVLIGGPPIPELEVIATYNVNETIENWGPYPTVLYTKESIGPNMVPISETKRSHGVDFDFFIERVINGSTWPTRLGQIQSGTALNVLSANNAQLLIASKEEHFDNPNSQKVGNRYGSIRRSISKGFRSISQSSVGQCLEVPYRIDTTPISEEDANVEIISTEDDYWNFEYRKDLEEEPTSPKKDNVKMVGIPRKNNDVNNQNPSILDPLFIPGYLLRSNYQIQGNYAGWRDIRELPLDSIDSPMGTIHVGYNELKQEYVVTPAILKETIPTVIPSKIGPTRKGLADTYRRNSVQMYDLYRNVYVVNSASWVDSQTGNYRSYTPYNNDRMRGKEIYDITLSSIIGYDKNGNPNFTDNETFRNKLIFTGYNTSFETRFFISLDEMEEQNKTEFGPMWSESLIQEINQFLKDATNNINYNKVSIPIIVESMSGRYKYSSDPEKTMFLGHSNNPRKWLLDIRDPEIPTFQKDFLNRLIYTINDLQERPNVPTLTNPDKTLYTMLENLDKDDIILDKTSILGDLIRNGDDAYTYASIARRKDAYGPNILQNIFYADMINWDSKLLNYDLKYNIEILRYKAEDLSRKCNSYGFLNKIFDENGQKYFRSNLLKYPYDSLNQTLRIVPLTKRYSSESAELRLSETIGPYILLKDKTRISDVYFGLKELHIKGYPWYQILNIIENNFSDVNLKLDIIEQTIQGKPVSYFKITAENKDGSELFQNFIRCHEIDKLSDIFSNQYDLIVSAFESAWKYMIDSRLIVESLTDVVDVGITENVTM